MEQQFMGLGMLWHASDYLWVGDSSLKGEFKFIATVRKSFKESFQKGILNG